MNVYIHTYKSRFGRCLNEINGRMNVSKKKKRKRFYIFAKRMNNWQGFDLYRFLTLRRKNGRWLVVRFLMKIFSCWLSISIMISIWSEIHHQQLILSFKSICFYLKYISDNGRVTTVLFLFLFIHTSL